MNNPKARIQPWLNNDFAIVVSYEGTTKMWLSGLALGEAVRKLNEVEQKGVQYIYILK